ncbi:MAG: winged helix-turn-helix transcriptional regulator [Maritimibacter sp.]
MRMPPDFEHLLSIGEPSLAPDDARVSGLADLAAQMGETPPGKDAPVREVMARLGDNWSALILKVLTTGTYRHATLKRVIGALSSEGEISQRMLTLRLRALERDGLVLRHEHDSVPPRVDYALSEMGRELTEEFDRLLAWIERHSDEINEARQAISDAP